MVEKMVEVEEVWALHRRIILKIDGKYYHIEVKNGLFKPSIVVIAEINGLNDKFGRSVDFDVICNKVYSLKSHIMYYAAHVRDKLKY
jgi:hypothetical protein